MSHRLIGVIQKEDEPCTWFLWCSCTPDTWISALVAHECDPAVCPLGLDHTYLKMKLDANGMPELDATGGHVYELTAEPRWEIVERTSSTITFKPSINAEPDHFHTTNPAANVPIRATW